MPNSSYAGSFEPGRSYTVTDVMGVTSVSLDGKVIMSQNQLDKYFTKRSCDIMGYKLATITVTIPVCLEDTDQMVEQIAEQAIINAIKQKTHKIELVDLPEEEY